MEKCSFTTIFIGCTGMRHCFFLPTVTLFFFHGMYAQNMPTLDPERYERPSLTFCLLSQPQEPYQQAILQGFEHVKVNDKFNDHTLPSLRVIPAPYDRTYLQPDKHKVVAKHLLNVQLPKQAVARWFNLQPNGTFNMDLIAERGVYNATDADVLRAKAKKRGLTAIQDAGESLINKSYIIVFDFTNVETWDDYYNRVDQNNARYAAANKTTYTPQKRVFKGYRGSMWAYLYKIKWNDSVSTHFYTKAWNNPAEFNKMLFNLEFVSQCAGIKVAGGMASVKSDISMQSLMVNFLQSGVESSLIIFSKKIPDFRVKAPLYNHKPLEAKIGLKEDLKVDQRFFAYEKRLNKKGEVTLVKRGVVKAKKVVDNRFNASGSMKPSQFYQDAGKKLYKGILLEQHYDYGISLMAGWAQRSMPGYLIRADFLAGKYVGIPRLRFYFDFHSGTKSAAIGNSAATFRATSTQISFGVGKEFSLTRNIHLEAFGGVIHDTTGIDFTNQQTFFLESESPDLVINASKWGLITGVRIPINVLHNLQIVPTAGLSTIQYSSRNSLYATRLNAQLITDNIAQELEIDKSVPGWNTNNPMRLNNFPLKWDVVIRYKF